MKKLVVAAVVVLAGLAAFLAYSRSSSTEAEARPLANRTVELQESAPAPAATEITAPAVPAVEPRSTVAAAPMPHRMLGRVLATPDDQPVAGATIELYAPELRTRAEFEALWAPRSQPSADGWIRPPTIPYEADNPTLLQLADLEPRGDYGPPPPGAVPLARAISDEHGLFELPSPNLDGLLIVRAEGYGQRGYAWIPREEETDAVSDVYVSRSGRLSARLIDEAGAPYEHRVALTLRGAVRFVLGTPEMHRNQETHFEVFDVETDEKGRFSLDVAAQAVFVQSRDPEIAVRQFGWAPLDGRGCEPRGWLTPGAETRDVVIVMRPTCVLAVTDARTGAPIERFHVRSKIQPGFSRGTAGWNGWFAAAGGLFRLTPEMDDFIDVAQREAQDGAWSGRVWAPGYAPTEVTVDSAWKGQRVEVKLEPGALATLAGRVTRGDAPAAGVPIILHPGIGTRWAPPIEGPGRIWVAFAGARTDADGRFAVELFPGRHMATIGEGTERISIVLDAPAADVRVDLAQSARLRVRVVTVDGTAATERPVRVHGPSGMRIDGTTDARGEFVVAATSPGAHKAGARVKQSLNGSDTWDAEREFDALPGAETVIDLVLPSDEPRHGRLVLVGATNPERWKVNVRFWSDSRVAVEPDGRIPIDLRTTGSFEFTGPDGFSMILSVPKDALDGHVFTIHVENRGYEGVLTSIVTKKPIKGVSVYAYLREPPAKGMHTATTDATGHFRLVGLEDAPYRIVFDSNRGPISAGENIDNYSIYPDENPAMPPRRLYFALPTRRGADLAGVETIQLVGRLRWESQKVEGAQAQLASAMPIPGARLFVTQIIQLSADGRYDVRLPRGDKYSAWFWQPTTDAKVSTDWIGSGAEVEAHDIDLP